MTSGLDIFAAPPARISIGEVTAGPAGASVRDDPDGSQRLDLSLPSAPPSLVPLSLAYRKSVVHSMPFKHSSYANAKTAFGDHYPQTFAVDADSDELFIVYANTTSTVQVVAVHSWSSGAFKSCFAYDCTVVSEGAVVKREADGKRYLYARTASATLSKFDVTVLPPDLTKITAASTHPNTAAGVNFTYRNGTWTANDSMPPIGGGVESRGFMKRMNDAFAVTGQFSFPESYSGGNSAGYRDNSMPKMQGFVEAEGYFALAIGGYHKVGAAVTPYAYQGTRLISGQGEILLDSLIHPEMMAAIMVEQGMKPTRVESEGIVSVGKSLFSLTVTSSYNLATDPHAATEGIVIFEEFSPKEDAIDFGRAAVTWTQTPVQRVQAGLEPRGSDGKLHNSVTNEVLDTLPKILAYMKLVNQSVLRFYSSSAAVTDAYGIRYPNGNLVTVYNVNNATAYVHVIGTAADTGISIVYPDAGGTLVQKSYSPKGSGGWLPASNRAGVPLTTFALIMAHMIDVGQTEYSFYSSNATVTNIAGVAIPPGNLVTVHNPNNSTFYFVVTGNENVVWKVFPNGASFTQQAVAPRLYSPNGTAYRLQVSDAGALSVVAG